MNNVRSRREGVSGFASRTRASDGALMKKDATGWKVAARQLGRRYPERGSDEEVQGDPSLEQIYATHMRQDV